MKKTGARIQDKNKKTGFVKENIVKKVGDRGRMGNAGNREPGGLFCAFGNTFY